MEILQSKTIQSVLLSRAEQGAVTLSCRESPGKAPAGSIEQIPFQWAGKGSVVLSQHSWVLAGAEQGCVCTAGLCVHSRAVPGRMLPCQAQPGPRLGLGCGDLEQSVGSALSCRVCQARPGHGGDQVRCDLLTQPAKRGWSEPRKGECRRRRAQPAAPWHCWALSPPQKQVCFSLEYKYTKLSKSWSNWQPCEETH